MGLFGSQIGELDTVVLGCTHYPFVSDTLRALVGPNVAFLEGGVPVARQTRRTLSEHALLAQPLTEPTPAIASPRFCTTGDPAVLQAAIQRWLGLQVPVQSLHLN